MGQGTSGASILGKVEDAHDRRIAGATVTLRDTSTGFARRTTSSENGNFFFENLAVGGPYEIKVIALGFSPVVTDGTLLHIGERAVVRIRMSETRAQSLRDVRVEGTSDLRNGGAGGPAYLIPAAAIRNLPLLNRDFTGLFGIAAQATGPSSLNVSGQHAKFNAIQVDGGSANDIFGINVTPGAVAGARVISLEALQEIQIAVAPFDVRQGGFSGGLINAVTRSGTNKYQGSTFISVTRPDLVGPDTASHVSDKFTSRQYGGTFGGPIIRNRLHFFTAIDLQSAQKPFVGQATSNPSIGIKDSTARRVQNIIRTNYGFDPGGPEAPDLHQPTANVFIKLSGQPSRRHSLELSQSWVDARTEELNRIVGSREAWQLSASGTTRFAHNRVTRFRATSVMGGLTNELMLSSTSLSYRSQSTNRTPIFLVQADVLNSFVAAGSSRGAQDTRTDQKIVEFTDNLTWNRDNHVLTFGTQNQLLHFRDNFFLGSWGTWTFGSVDSLARGVPSQYEVALPVRSGGPFADYRVTIISGYAQDRWNPTQRLSLTAGLRTDIPYSNAPVINPALAANARLGNIDTSRFPSGNGLVSARLGFTFDLGSSGSAQLRGGIGSFTGRPPFAWLSGAFVNTGLEQSLLICRSREGIPAATADITSLPTQCLQSQPSAGAVPTINSVDPNFRFQQSVKHVLGFDRRFAGGMKSSIDIILTRTRNSLLVDDINLQAPSVNSEGRAMYGSLGSTGISSPKRIDAAFGPVFLFHNRTAEKSISISGTLNKAWTSGAHVDVGYNWSRTQDVMSVVANNAILLFQRSPIDGTIADRRLGISNRDIPHNLVASSTIPLRWGFAISPYLRARSGTPFAYVVTGDANGDGTTPNDLVYVPRDQSDITLADPSTYAALDNFIASEPCLRSQKGRILSRNSCRNPAVFNLDMRVAKSFQARRINNVELIADIFNLPNLLSGKWGLIRETSPGESKSGLLTVSGWDAATNRARYSIAKLNGKPLLPGREGVVIDASRWRIQIGGRYSF